MSGGPRARFTVYAHVRLQTNTADPDELAAHAEKGSGV